MSNRYDEHMVFHVVYFILATQSGRIKIGTTKCISSRFETLQNASGEPLLIMATMPGDHRHEAEIHDRFRASRLHREWFAGTPELHEYIGDIAKRGMGAKLPAVVVEKLPPKPIAHPSVLAEQAKGIVKMIADRRAAMAARGREAAE